MAALWSAATVKLIGAGLDDARHAEDVVRLIGEHDVALASMTRDATGHTSWNTSVTRRRILEPGELRALPRAAGRSRCGRAAVGARVRRLWSGHRLTSAQKGSWSVPSHRSAFSNSSALSIQPPARVTAFDPT